MWKRIMVCLILIALAAMPVRAAPLEVSAPSAILMETVTGTVLFEKNAHERLPPASVTKIMTLLLVMEALESGRITWEDSVTASETAASKGGSQIYLEAGEQMSVDEMLKSVVVSSANDCATALAEHVAGSESAFVDMMNRRAVDLGMNDTHFVNCTGLDDGPDGEEHLTSAYDIALMSRELLKHDAVRKYTTIWMDTVRNGTFGLSNTNRLVRFYEGTTGLKTGYTSQAGHCLSASAARGGVEYVAVVLHCDSSDQRFQSAKQLLDYGFANYTLAVPVPQEAIGEVPVILGAADSIVPVVMDPSPLLIEKSLQKSIVAQVEVAEQVKAPVEAGQRLGTMTVRADGKHLASIPLVAPESVAKKTWMQITGDLLRIVCYGS